MPSSRHALVVLALCTALACAAKDEQPKGAEAKSSDVTRSVEEAVEREVQKAEFELGLDSKSLRKKACELLTAEMVASTFDVPAADLKQTKIMGCVYTWKNGTETMQAQIMMPRVHKSIQAAKTWFQNATATRTKEELDAQMDHVTKKAQEDERIDTRLKKNTTKKVGGLMKMAIPDEGISYDDVAGIGDEARISSDDGSIRVRVGNTTFKVIAYRSKAKPEPKFVAANPKKMMAEAMKVERKWIAETMDARRSGGEKIAKQIVENLKKL